MTKASYISTKGQVVIPAWLRKKLGLKPGTRVSFSEQGRDIVMHAHTPATINSLAGSWGRGSKEVDFLLEERKKDLERENAKIKRALRSR